MEIRPTTGDAGWFTHDRFGLFIHWGLYALPARHEWVQSRELIPGDVYERKYFRHFDPDLYRPELWADAAAGAGMKYMVVTTKPHEGFCLWDSALTDYKAPNTPAGRDLLRPLVEAFRERQLHIGFYHSLIDWHHPEFLIDGIHPLRQHPEKESLNAGRRQELYAQYLRGQVRELLTQFGRVDVMWLDFSYPQRPDGKGRKDWQSEELYKMIRELQPHILLNDRMDLPDAWDFKTPEQNQPRAWVTVDGQPIVWEACHTFSGSWGYHRDETSWKSVEQLLLLLVDSVSKGGNLLLNVGPTGRGEFDERALARLQGMGAWMQKHSRAIYGCTQAPAGFSTPADCRLTYNPAANRLYVHMFTWPVQYLHLDGFAGKVEYAQLLHDASEVPFDTTGTTEGAIRLRLPALKPNVAVPVVELFLH